MPVRLDSIGEAQPSAPVRLSDVEATGRRLSDVGADPAKPKRTTAMETVSDIGQVYPLVEAALAGTTGLIFGFPMYLGGGVGQLINRATGQSDELPTDVGERFAKAVTYQPRTERGKRLTETAGLPLRALGEGASTAGHKVTDVTGSPAAGALTESTIQMAPAFLGGPIARAHDATLPKFTGREGERPAPGSFEAPKPEPIERPPTTGTSSGVPIRLDKLIAEAEQLGRGGGIQEPPKSGVVRPAAQEGKLPPQQGTTRIEQLVEEARRNAEGLEPPPMRNIIGAAAQEGRIPPQQGATPLDALVRRAETDWQLPQPPNVRELINGIKAEGPTQTAMDMQAPGTAGREPPAPAAPAAPAQPRQPIPPLPQSQFDLSKPPGEAPLPGEPLPPGEARTPPAAAAPRGEAPAQPAGPKPYDAEKEYPVEPLVIPLSEVRGEQSGGKTRKVYELVQANTPFERVLADSGRDWKTKAQQDAARERLTAAIRQLTGEDAARFAELRRMPPERQMEAARQDRASVRTDLHNARLADPEAHIVRIEAPDAERAIFFGPERPAPAGAAPPATPPVVPRGTSRAPLLERPPELQSYTAADLADKTAREGDTGLAERERIKRESEAGAGSFRLASDEKPAAVRDAEQQAAQGDLLGAPPKTEPKAKRAKQDPKSHLFSDIKEMGGIASNLMRDLTGESNARFKKGIPVGIFPVKGKASRYATTDLSWIADRLKDRGYLIDEGDWTRVEEMIKDEIANPGTHKSAFDEQAGFDKLARERDAALKNQKPGEELHPNELLADEDALQQFGPGTLGSNPMFNPALIKDMLDSGIKKMLGWANAIQSAPETARGAIAPLHEYARSIQAAKETAQRDVIEGDARAGAIRDDYTKSMQQVLSVNPRFQTVKATTLKEAAREIERAKRDIAAAELRAKLLKDGYALRRHSNQLPGDTDVFRQPPLNMAALRDPRTGLSLLIREDAIPLVEQMVGAHDVGLERSYGKSVAGKIEAANHGMVSWLMQNPLFHLVTTGGKALAYTVPAPGRSSLLNYWQQAGEVMNDRAQFSDWVRAGMQPFPVRAKMEPTGAAAGAFEKAMNSIGLDKPYEAYQWIHRNVLANNVNKIQMSFSLMRLEQLVKQAQKDGQQITPERMEVLKTTAAQESNPIGGNLPKEELNRILYRALGFGLFSRGLQVSTVRFLTRTIENNEIVRSVARAKGYSESEARILTDRNRNFLAAGLMLDYAVMQVVSNAINYATTNMYDDPDKEGKKGGHFVWENPGSTKASMVFPNSIFLKPKTDDNGERTGEGIYISNPVRTVRDIIEYAMIPFQIGGGEKPQVLFNKFSPLANLGKGVMSGTDWAGRPLGGPGDVAAETASMGMPAPMGDLPRYALEAYRSDNSSFLTEGIKKMFDPEMAIPVLLGMQPRVSSKDPTTTQEANEQSADERKLWARVSRVKQLSKNIDPEVREEQIKSVLDQARKLHMPGTRINEINRVMRNQGVSKSQVGAAARSRARKEDQIDAPPEEAFQ